MKVVITGTDAWAITRAARELASAGHDVLTCHDDDGPAFPCVGLRGAPCPVEQDVDVVLTVRAHPLPHPARREIAVTCALHQGIPLVVAGRTALNPFERFATVITEGIDELVAACQLAAGLGPPTGPTVPGGIRHGDTIFEIHLETSGNLEARTDIDPAPTERRP